MGVPFTLDLHPEAGRNFDEKAEGLLPLVSVVPVVGKHEAGFRPDVYVRAHFTEREIIGEIETAFRDYRGRETGRIFDHDGRTLGLVGKGFKDLEALATQLQRAGRIRPYVSVRCLINTAFRWVKKRYRGETNEPFTGYVLRECATLVKESEIWIPLFHVYIQTELSVGKIRFKTLTREMLDSYLERVLKSLPQENQAAFQVQFDRTRSRLQGCAAATIALTAEPLRAQEVAGEEAGYSIAALRFFHAANMTPYLRCYCTPAGAENLLASSTLTVDSGMIQQWQDSASPTGNMEWVLSDQEIRELQSAGLDALSRLLARDERSPFEDELLDAILLHSRNSLFDDAANRLVYILAAVESILLRDSNEPVGKNIGERLAFVIGRTAEERTAIRDNVTHVYALRSAFLHHGRALREMDSLELFMRYVWTGFVALIHGMDKFRTKQELIEALERRKME
ncbi:MAG: hypothetical protein ABSH01_28250 [Terriglobia bacterium]|jgi:hypothetical protein